MKNVEALKKLYIKLGGNAEDVANVTTIADAIDKLTEVAQGGGSGGEPFVVTLTITGESSATGDKTAAEIKEAVEAGKQIVVCAETGADETDYLNAIVYQVGVNGYIGLQAIAVSAYNLLEARFEPNSESDIYWSLATKQFDAGRLFVSVTIDTVGADRTETLQYVFSGIQNSFSEGLDVYINYFDVQEGELWSAPVTRMGYTPHPDVAGTNLYFVEIANGYRWTTDDVDSHPSRTISA